MSADGEALSKELKKQFNRFIKTAQSALEEGDVSTAIKSFEEAKAIYPTSKLEAKIEKLKKKFPDASQNVLVDISVNSKVSSCSTVTQKNR